MTSIQWTETARDALSRARTKIDEAVSRHLETLANRRDALVRFDRYGVVEGKEWSKEVQHFLDKVVRPSITDYEADALAEAGLSIIANELIEDRVASYCEQRKAPASVPSDISPIEFEGLCAAVFREQGWSASTTKASGDQGADVLAEKNGVKAVLQCKLYSSTIGNKAIQEALAAKLYYNAQIAIVVSKSDFTRSAKELAQSTGVHILHFSELANFAATAHTLSGAQA